MEPSSSSLFPILCFLSLLLSTPLVIKSNGQSTVPYNEKNILLNLKTEWGNPPALSSWNSSSSNYCNWTGVTCTSGTVSELILSYQNLNESIPPSICELKNLSHLDLSYNDLPGTFPLFLYNCSSLEYLDLSQNWFVGEIPQDTDKLSPSLTYLSLAANNFTGDVPSSIGMLKNLTYLFLDNNFFNGTYPIEISDLSKLEYLTLAWNLFIPARIPPEFGKLKKLKYLWMTQMNIAGEIPDSLSNLTEIEHFDLSWNQINGTIPSWIWEREKLNILYLYSNKLSGEINIIGPFKAVGLVALDLSINNLTGSIPEDFGSLKNLTTFLLYYNRLTGKIPTSIGLLPMLQDVRLFNNNLTGELPPELGKHSNLVNFEVDNNKLSGELPRYICSRRRLINLAVFYNNFTGEIPDSLASCYTLKSIQIYRNKFFGEFPFGIWSAVNLSLVLIHDNKLAGTLPRSLPWNLTRVEMSNNRFTGNIPLLAPRLQVFLASDNSFTGDIPQELTGMSQLTDLSLSGNQLTGSIPPNISVLQSLTRLNLSHNQLTGSIPDAIGLIPVLTSLDLSDNQLSGSIPPELGNLKLNVLNLSVNQLTGLIPASLENQAYERSFLSNPGLCSNFNSIPNFPTCRHKTNRSNELSKELLIIFITLGCVVLIGMTAIGMLIIRGRKESLDFVTWKFTPFHKLDFSENDIIRGLTEENLIGSGGSGKVYKIRLRNGETVAVKKIWNGRKLDQKLEKEFQAEVEILGMIRHVNIVKLLCCISSSDSKLLVYEYMENSSLDRWLYGKERTANSQPLDWPMRVRIAIDAANGLCYMHHSYLQPIVHRDVKSSNILLDPEFRAKVADFGLALVLVKSGEPESVSVIAGSFGYMAPECGYKRKINEKVDVYSFGVVLLELTTGKRANEGDEFESLADWALRYYKEDGRLDDIIDEQIRDPLYLEDVLDIFRLGLLCTTKSPVDRPTMKDIVQYLSRYNRTKQANTVNELTIESHCESCFEGDPLILSKKGSRRKSSSATSLDGDRGDVSSDFVVHIV